MTGKIDPQAFYWFIIDFIELLAKQLALHAGFTSKDLKKAHNVEEWFKNMVLTTLPGIANVVELIEKLGEKGFHALYLGWDYFNNIGLPDLLVAKNGKTFFVECKGEISKNKAKEQYKRRFINPSKGQDHWIKFKDHLNKNYKINVYLAYKRNGKWYFLEYKAGNWKEYSFDEFVKLYN